MATNEPTPLEAATVQAVVTLTVTPRVGQSIEDAQVEMLGFLSEYLTEREHPFLSDYGATVEDLTAFREGEDEEPTWGGFEGPFVLDSKVQGLTLGETVVSE